MTRRPRVPSKALRAWERAMLFTLSDGGIWRYYNVSDMWECFSGGMKERFSDKPVRADRAPLTAADQAHIDRIRLYASAPGARAQTLHPKRLGGAS